MRKSGILTVALLTGALASAQDWTASSTKDAFTDEEVWSARVAHKAAITNFRYS